MLLARSVKVRIRAQFFVVAFFVGVKLDAKRNFAINQKKSRRLTIRR